MTKFYLSNSYKIPASGFYQYTVTETNGQLSFVKQKIKCDGEPGDEEDVNPPVYTTQDKPPEAPLGPNSHIWPSDWFEIASNSNTTTYLALMPAGEGDPLHIWKNALETYGANQFALPDNVRRVITAILRNRREEGYKKLSEHLSANAPHDLAENADLYWEGLENVSLCIIEHIEYTLDAVSSPGNQYKSLGKFKEPDWVFQLNRTLAEGFIEGHAQPPFNLIPSGNYDIPPDNLQIWKDVLQHAIDDMTLERLHQLPSDQQRVMNILPMAIINHFGLDNIALPTILDIVLHVIIMEFSTPGGTPEQEFAFWNLHYPHWHKDLVYALQLYGAHPNDEDWDTITQLVMMGYPTEGASLSLNDWLMGTVLRTIGMSGATFPDLVTCIVVDVFKDVQQKGALPLPCPE